MTSTTSPSDTIRLKSRIPARELAAARPAERPRPDPAPIVPLRPAAPPTRLAPIESIELRAVRRITARPWWARAGQRAFDLAVAIIGLIVLAPLMVVVALAVVIDSPGPVFYGSPRLGRHGSLFRAWKFRSMRPEADGQLDRLLADDPRAQREYARFHKLRRDPRLTRIGAAIRQGSLDELPQLLNILRGEMSVVGPRPKLVHDAEAYGAELEIVLSVKPGLTGLWQVSGRNRLPMDERVALDLLYVEERTFLGDLAICWRTFLQLWRPRKHGAY